MFYKGIGFDFIKVNRIIDSRCFFGAGNADFIIASTEEGCGIYWHEVAHALFGSLDQQTAMSDMMAAYHEDLNEELICDDFAATIVGPDKLQHELELLRVELKATMKIQVDSLLYFHLVNSFNILNARIERLKK